MAKTKQPEYTLFITLNKLLHEGGKLRVGRMVYNKYNSLHWEAGTYLRKDSKKGQLILKPLIGRKLVRLHEFDSYVKIPCTPIYK